MILGTVFPKNTKKYSKISLKKPIFKIPGSRRLNPGISGLENLSESRDFGIGIIPGFTPNTKFKLSKPPLCLGKISNTSRC